MHKDKDRPMKTMRRLTAGLVESSSIVVAPIAIIAIILAYIGSIALLTCLGSSLWPWIGSWSIVAVLVPGLGLAALMFMGMAAVGLGIHDLMERIADSIRDGA